MEEAKLKRSMLEHFPTLMKELDSCKTQKEFDMVHTRHLSNYVNSLNELLGGKVVSVLQYSQDSSDETAPIVLKPETCEILLRATGSDIKNQVQKLLDGLARLKGMDKDDAGQVTVQVIQSGCLAIGTAASSTCIQNLVEGASEIVAALAAVEAVTVSVVCLTASIVIVGIIIPLIYFIEKPATGIVLLINDLDEEINFVEDYNEHGKKKLITTPIPGSTVIKEKRYVSGGLIASTKKDSALIGTQYGVTYKYKHIEFQLAFQVPLTGIYVDNNRYASVGSSAKVAADQTYRHNMTSWSAEGQGIKVDIKVNSSGGSVAYYIARVYKSPSKSPAN